MRFDKRHYSVGREEQYDKVTASIERAGSVGMATLLNQDSQDQLNKRRDIEAYSSLTPSKDVVLGDKKPDGVDTQLKSLSSVMSRNETGKRLQLPASAVEATSVTMRIPVERSPANQLTTLNATETFGPSTGRQKLDEKPPAGITSNALTGSTK